MGAGFLVTKLEDGFLPTLCHWARDRRNTGNFPPQILWRNLYMDPELDIAGSQIDPSKFRICPSGSLECKETKLNEGSLHLVTRRLTFSAAEAS